MINEERFSTDSFRRHNKFQHYPQRFSLRTNVILQNQATTQIQHNNIIELKRRTISNEIHEYEVQLVCAFFYLDNN